MGLLCPMQGLLAGVNDYELLEKTGGVRDINRHYYTVEEAEKALQRPVVQVKTLRCNPDSVWYCRPWSALWPFLAHKNEPLPRILARHVLAP